MCASSITYTFLLALAGTSLTASRRVRISSIPRWDAASNSITSMFEPAVIDKHCLHLLQGSNFPTPRKDFDFDSQLTTLAIILAADVLPLPLGPKKRKA